MLLKRLKNILEAKKRRIKINSENKFKCFNDDSYMKNGKLWTINKVLKKR